MAARQLVVAEGRDEERPALAKPPHEVVEELEGGTVRPVKILENQDEWSGPTIEETSHRLVEPPEPQFAGGAVRTGRLEVGRARGEGTRAGARRAGVGSARQLAEPVEGFDERGEGKHVRPELKTAANHDGRSFGSDPASELRDEAGLPDAGFPADKAARSSRTVGQRDLKPGELLLATKERRTGLPRRHGSQGSRPPGVREGLSDEPSECELRRSRPRARARTVTK